jgi:hypothetical protein
VTPGGAAVLGVLVAGLLVLAALTALGSRRRGGRWPLAVVSGAFFPVTWVAWYVRDGGHSQRRA